MAAAGAAETAAGAGAEGAAEAPVPAGDEPQLTLVSAVRTRGTGF